MKLKKVDVVENGNSGTVPIKASDVVELKNLRVALLRAQKQMQLADAEEKKSIAAIESKIIDVLVAAECDPHDWGVDIDAGAIVKKQPAPRD